MKYLKTEVQSTMNLEHKHIVKYHKFEEKTQWVKPNGEVVPVAYIAQEPVLGGELFDYVANSGSFSEPICRYYFKQLLQALTYLHMKGFSHRDLKFENILIDANYDLKIVDFGFCCPLKGRDGSGYNRSYVGTPAYMAPEIIRRNFYKGEDVDLFAAAVIIFTMMSGSPPFMKWAEKNDDFYKLICENKSKTFWRAHEQFKEKNFFSADFKDLITCMLQENPILRLSTLDVIGSPWMQGPIATREEV